MSFLRLLITFKMFYSNKRSKSPGYFIDKQVSSNRSQGVTSYFTLARRRRINDTAATVWGIQLIHKAAVKKILYLSKDPHIYAQKLVRTNYNVEYSIIVEDGSQEILKSLMVIFTLTFDWNCCEVTSMHRTYGIRLVIVFTLGFFC